MPRTLARYHHTGNLHFLTFSCYDRRPYLDAPTRDLFEQALERIRARYQVSVFGYVLMPEHAHMLVSEPLAAPLATFMQALKLSVARRATQRPFWQRRYYDFNVYSAKKQVEKLRYMHRNPVTRGMVQTPDDWRWSSFHHWLTGEPARVQLTSRWTNTIATTTTSSTRPHISNSRCGAPAFQDNL